MKFFGMEKLSLVDYDNHTACTVFTGGCNFRCPYCHNGDLVDVVNNAVCVSESEVLEYLTKRKNLIDGLVVSGGEPTLHRDLPDFLLKVKAIGCNVKLDTNGTSPDMLKSLIDSKLVDFVAMDIKNSPNKYPVTVGTADLDLTAIFKSAALLMENNVPYEFRTTVISELHEEKDFEDIGRWLQGAEKYFVQRYRDADGCLSHGYTEVPELTAKGFVSALSKYVKNAALRGY